MELALMTGLIGGVLGGVVGGSLIQTIWGIVRYGPGRTFSFEDFLEGVKVGGAQEEDYQHKLNLERLNQLKMFCEENNDQGYVPINEMLAYVESLE